MTHVLVTRPLESAQALAGKLESLGLLPIVMPLYGFSKREPSLDMVSDCSAHKDQAPARRQLAIFTSPRAVQFGLAHIPLDQLTDLEFAAIGSATRSELEACGHAVHLQAAAGYTSEDLLQLPELVRDPGDAFIFCAPGGRETLVEGLDDLGWRVVKAMVYERVPLQPGSETIDALLGAEDLVTVWTSISALKLAMETLPGDAWKKILMAPALVISTRIQHHLQQLGATSVELADGPGNPELLQSILRLMGQQASG
jgi:uroporphyrinogen-III synthase